MQAQDTSTARTAPTAPMSGRSDAAQPAAPSGLASDLVRALQGEATRRPLPSDPDAGELEYRSWRVR